MSLLAVTDGPGQADWTLFHYGSSLLKQAASTPAYNLVGMLYLAPTNWLLLSVPNALVRGIFQAMHEPGAEMPQGPDGRLNAHISVCTPEDLERIGGADKISERGKQFHYTLGRLVEIDSPGGWSEMAKVWMMRVHSPELQAFRRSYGLSSLPHDGEYDFHITVSVRRRGVLGRNEVSKQSPEPVPA